METDTIFDLCTETFELPDGSFVNCEIMDTGGQEEFDAQNRLYYKRADCCLLVYDITRKDTFDAIKNFYIKEIKDNCIEDIKVILLGNKTDLKDQRQVTLKEGSKLASKQKFYFMETSCEQNFNVMDAFETIIIMTNNEMIKNRRLHYEEKEDIEKFKLSKEEDDEISKIKDEDLKKDVKKKRNKKKWKCCSII